MFAANNEEYEDSSKGSWATSPQRPSRAEARRAEGRRASTGSSASLTHSNSVKSKHHSKHPPHVHVRVLPLMQRMHALSMQTHNVVSAYKFEAKPCRVI